MLRALLNRTQRVVREQCIANPAVLRELRGIGIRRGALRLRPALLEACPLDAGVADIDAEA
jgi:hypothetical protein